MLKGADVSVQGIYPPQYGSGQEFQAQNAQYLCLDLLLAFINHMTERSQGVRQLHICVDVSLTAYAALSVNRGVATGTLLVVRGMHITEHLSRTILVPKSSFRLKRRRSSS